MPLPLIRMDFNSNSLANRWTAEDIARQRIELDADMRCVFYDLDLKQVNPVRISPEFAAEIPGVFSALARPLCGSHGIVGSRISIALSLPLDAVRCRGGSGHPDPDFVSLIDHSRRWLNKRKNIIAIGFQARMRNSTFLPVRIT